MLKTMDVKAVGEQIGREMASDVIADGGLRDWTGMDLQAEAELLAAGLENGTPEWRVAVAAVRGSFEAVMSWALARGDALETLRQAIERSRSSNEAVAIEYGGSRDDLIVDLDEISEGEIDDATENDGRIDVWGFLGDKMEWRLLVRVNERA